MRLYYHQSAKGNFGDDLNLWLWDDLLPGWRQWPGNAVLVGVGTLLSSTFLEREGLPREDVEGQDVPRYLVAGTGVGYGSGALPDVQDPARWDVRSLRGPISARRLGLPEGLGMLDPAAMLPELPRFADLRDTGETVFVPHEGSVARHDWANACAAAGLAYVSPRGDAEEVIRAIAGARLVVAESLHAAIVADAFGVPWVPVRIGWQFNAEKWQDWALALGLEIGSIPPLFPALERGFAAARAARAPLRSRPSRQASGPARSADPDAAFARPGRALGWRLALERRGLAAALADRARARPMLADRAALARQRARYRAVLDGIGADHGG